MQMQRTSEDYDLRDTLAALQRARSLENADDVRVIQHRLQTFSLHDILPLLQQARDQENSIIVQDLREAAVSIHAVTFEAMTDSDLRPAMAAARSAGDNLRIQPYSASLMVGNASGPGQICCTVVLRMQNVASVSILLKSQDLTPSTSLFLQPILLVLFGGLVLVATFSTDNA